MANYIPRYRDNFKTEIKVCYHCKRIEELPVSKQDCPQCHLGPMLHWDTVNHFIGYLRRWKPVSFNIVDEHLAYLLDEVLEEEKERIALS